jgi:hypothetical protein
VSSLLRPTSPHRRIVSRFLPIELRRARCLSFIFRRHLFCRLPSRTKTEALNPHHRRRLPSPDRLTLILHCYKKIISILITLPITQPHLHFVFSLARVPCHQSSPRRGRSLLLLSHAHCHSAQWHTQWQTCRPSFASLGMWIYLKRYFKISQHRTGL